jgi:hypothetical protein
MTPASHKFFRSPTTGKFAGSPASLLLISALAVYCAIDSFQGGLSGASPRTARLLALIFLAVGAGALYLSRAAWKRHSDTKPGE